MNISEINELGQNNVNLEILEKALYQIREYLDKENENYIRNNVEMEYIEKNFNINYGKYQTLKEYNKKEALRVLKEMVELDIEYNLKKKLEIELKSKLEMKKKELLKIEQIRDKLNAFSRLEKEAYYETTFDSDKKRLIQSKKIL